MKRSVSIHLSEFAREAVAGEDRDVDRVAAAVVRAVRCYIGSGESGGPGWSYPGFAQADDQDGAVEVSLSIDEDLWRSLATEAERQGASTEEMVVHAALWFAAEVDAGRITQRIIEGLGDDGGGGTRPV